MSATSIQAYGIDYEFDIVGELNQQHVFHISKSRCFELQDTSWVKPGMELGNVLKTWIGNTKVVKVVNPNNQRIKQIRKLLAISSDAVLYWLDNQTFAKTPADLSKEQIDKLVEWMAVEWAKKQKMNIDRAIESFQGYVPLIVSQGYAEIQVLKEWMQLVIQEVFTLIKT